MKTKFRESFSRDIDKIKSSDITNKIHDIIILVEQANKPQDIPNIIKMKGYIL